MMQTFVQNRAQMASQWSPHAALEASKCSRRPQDGSRGAKMASMKPQHGSNGPQHDPKQSQGGPKRTQGGAQDGPKMPLISLPWSQMWTQKESPTGP